MLIDKYGYYATIYSLVYFVVTTISVCNGENPPPEWFWLVSCFLFGPVTLAGFYRMENWIKKKYHTYKKRKNSGL